MILLMAPGDRFCRPDLPHPFGQRPLRPRVRHGWTGRAVGFDLPRPPTPWPIFETEVGQEPKRVFRGGCVLLDPHETGHLEATLGLTVPFQIQLSSYGWLVY